MITIDAEVSSTEEDRSLIAPIWHTGLLFFLCLMAFAAGAIGTHRIGRSRVFAPTEYRELIYIAGLLIEFGIFALVYAGLYLQKTALSALIGKTWNDSRDITRDIALGIGAIVLVVCLTGAIFYLFGPADSSHADIYPKTAVQFYFFFLLALAGAFTEEIVFRGYFLKQFTYLFKSKTVSILLQALLFSIAHVGENIPWMCQKFLIGLLFGYIASERKSLIPTIVAHSGINAIAAILSVAV